MPNENNFVGGDVSGVTQQQPTTKAANLSDSSPRKGRGFYQGTERVKEGEFAPIPVEKRDRASCPPLRRMDKAEILEFVNKYKANQVYHSDMMRAEDVGLHFMPIMFGGLDPFHPDELRENLAFIFAYLDMDAPMATAINGLPCFGRCRLMHREDWKIIQPIIERIHQNDKALEESIAAEVEGK
jgi:hypothetical protein